MSCNRVVIVINLKLLGVIVLNEIAIVYCHVKNRKLCQYNEININIFTVWTLDGLFIEYFIFLISHCVLKFIATKYKILQKPDVIFHLFLFI